MLWLFEDTLHSPTMANCWSVNTNGNASDVLSHVSVEKVNEPNYHVTASLLVTFRVLVWRPWGVPLHNGEPGDLHQNVLFLSVNLMGEVCVVFSSRKSVVKL